MQKLREITYRTACFYTVASLIYVLLVALMVPGEAEVFSAYMQVFRNLAVLFGFSCVFGVSFMVFDIKKAPRSACRILHIIVLYAAMLAAFFLMANVTDDARSQVLFVFMATFVFIVAYGLGMAVSYFVNKAKGSTATGKQ